MKDTGTYIYLVIGVIIAILDFFRKEQKKKQKKEPKKTSSQSDTWKEIKKQWKEVIEEQQAPPTKKEHNKAKQQKTGFDKARPQPLSYETTDNVSKLRVKKQVRESISQTHKKTTSHPTETPKTAFDIALNQPSEIRKAIIYSEIFNKKYIQ